MHSGEMNCCFCIKYFDVKCNWKSGYCMWHADEVNHDKNNTVCDGNGVMLVQFSLFLLCICNSENLQSPVSLVGWLMNNTYQAGRENKNKRYSKTFTNWRSRYSIFSCLVTDTQFS